MRSVYDAIKAVPSFRPQAITSNANGISVDTIGYYSSAVVLEVGAVSGTSPTLNVKIQESADGTTWTDVPGANFSQVTGSNQSQIIRIEGLGTSRKRYLRASASVGGTSPSFTAAVEFLLGRAYKEPVN
jgi:hypothetical protein